MTNKINYNRRQFLQHSAFGAAAMGAFPGMLFAKTGQQQNKATPGFKADVEMEFTSRDAYVSVIKGGRKTKVQKYDAKLLKGPKNTLVELKGNYLGPILNYIKGQQARHATSQHSGTLVTNIHSPTQRMGDALVARPASVSTTHKTLLR